MKDVAHAQFVKRKLPPLHGLALEKFALPPVALMVTGSQVAAAHMRCGRHVGRLHRGGHKDHRAGGGACQGRVPPRA